MTKTKTLRCPECGGSEIHAEQKAFVRQRFSVLESGAVEYEAFTSEDVEFDGPEWFACQDCGTEDEKASTFVAP